MAQTCSKCNRANPSEAVYCYHDGFVLVRHAHNGAPVAVGLQPFANPFVFPTGRACRNFNELSLACQEEWNAARDLLHQGHLESFLGGLGRMDLVHAAREAKRSPNADQSLDELLSKFPGEVLAAPKLRVEPLEVNLGTLGGGDKHQIELHLENGGMRLLHGSISCDADWLTLGDAPGVVNKHFQFGHEQTFPVKLCSDRLRAGNKPLEATLLIETNGGTATVVVRANVPIKPFPPGVLGGSRSPRQVAEKAKANPKEAAALFENGTVANWYKANGWQYPVQGPAASGLGAVQQFFEALGLTPPPKVEINRRKIDLEGSPGQTLQVAVELKTQEKRPIYAHAVSSEPWLEVSRAKLAGRVATIAMSVPAVPNRPGETLTAQLTVQSNGSQRFVIPVRLLIGDSGAFEFAGRAPALETMSGDFDSTLLNDVPGSITPQPKEPAFSVPLPPRRPPASALGLLHFLPVVPLLLLLGALAVWDFTGSAQPAGPVVNGLPPTTPRDPKGVSWTYNIEDREPLLLVDFNRETVRFGIVMTKEQVNGAPKKLTFNPEGGTNNTCVKIDGSAHLFGKSPFVFEGKSRVEKVGDWSWQTVMVHPEKKIRVKQYVEVVPGEQSRRLDTCLVYYKVENFGTVPRTVGLRMLLDTFIGANDGVPFVIPGQPGLLQEAREFSEKEIPDYIEALETNDLQNPGTVVHLGLAGIKLPGAELEPINKMLLCRWPAGSGSEVRWEPTDAEKKLPFKIPDRQDDDSCVFLYWPTLKLEPGEKREMAFTYGLGRIAVDARVSDSQLGLSAGGAFRPGAEFTVIAYVKGAKEGQQVTLQLPEGLRLAGTQEATQTVPLPGGQPYSQVSWRVTAGANGDYKLTATSDGKTVSHAVKIKSSGLFD